MKIENIKISLLAEDPNNARKHGDKNLRAIKGSLAKFGQQKPIVVNKSNVVLAGNGTLRAAMELGWEEIQIVRTDLEGYNAAAFALADNKTSELAEWDYEVLNKAVDELKLEDFDLSSIGFDQEMSFSDENESEKDDSESGEEGEEKYTKKINAPIYEPKQEVQPEVSSLVDFTKTNILLKEIESSNVSEEIKTFLRAAAQRHAVFNYEQIAEFYAHATKDIQNLMENSALVIIDYNKAIENGFVKLSQELAETYENEE